MNISQLNKIRFISLNALRQITISIFSVIIPFLVIHLSSIQIWGQFVSILLYTLIAIQFINWGSKEYLLRSFSKYPNKITPNFSSSLTTRLPLVLLFSIISFILFDFYLGICLFIWLIGRFLAHSFEALIIFERKFIYNFVIETLSFLTFSFFLYYFKENLTLNLLIILYSLYQFLKGFGLLILFKNQFSLKNISIDFNFYKKSFWFFLLSLLGFLSSKIDLYISQLFLDEKTLGKYQIINGLLVFTMTISSFIYQPFTKNIYRNNPKIILKAKSLLFSLGLIIVPLAIILIQILLKLWLNISLPFYFSLIAFLYILPSFIYGIDIVNEFRNNKVRRVVHFLFISIVLNILLSYLFLSMNYGIMGAISGSMIAQLTLIFLFKRSSREQNLKRLFYSQLIQKDNLCFDIGANIGSKSKLYLSLGAKVVAFEPQSNCFDNLNKIKNSNKNFDFHQMAIGGQNNIKRLYLSNHIETASLSRKFIDFYSEKGSAWGQGIEVNIYSLDFIIEKYGLPDYCKIDVEGYEYEILSNLSYNIKLIEFEFTEGCFDDTLKIVKLLKTDNNRFNFVLNENLKFKLKNWITGEELEKILIKLPKKDLHGNIFLKSNSIEKFRK